MSKYLKRTSLATSVLIILVQPVFAESDSDLVGRLISRLGSATYTLDIKQLDTGIRILPPRFDKHALKSRPDIKDYQLSISCSGCVDYTKPYSERFFETPVGAFRLWDGSSDVITIWASGSGYRVVIYHLTISGILKTLDRGTKSAPQFGFDHEGAIVVVLDDPDILGRSSVTLSGNVWAVK